MNSEELENVILKAIAWSNKRLELQNQKITEDQKNYLIFSIIEFMKPTTEH